LTHEIISQSKERIRNGIDWTVRAHPTVAAGIAGAAVTVVGAYVALSTGNGNDAAVPARPPAAVGAAPNAPRLNDDLRPSPTGPSAPGHSARPDRPESGSGAPPKADRPPRTAAPHAPAAAAAVQRPSSAGGRSSSGSSGSGGSSGAGSGGGGGGGTAPAPAQPPAAQPPPASPQPTTPPAKDCVLRVNLLGDLVKVCL
jgi:uncharacterized membrane protein YgcG